jgi:hypothetical protein
MPSPRLWTGALYKLRFTGLEILENDFHENGFRVLQSEVVSSMKNIEELVPNLIDIVMDQNVLSGFCPKRMSQGRAVTKLDQHFAEHLDITGFDQTTHTFINNPTTSL